MQDKLRAMARSLQNQRFLLSVGPMRTAIDPVRFIQNRSSGAMGLALAHAAQALGAQVQVLLGPVSDKMAENFRPFETTRYLSAADYESALRRLFPTCSVFISLAAVLDFHVTTAPQKIPRESLGSSLVLPIRPIPDFTAWAVSQKKPGQQVIAFAAETGTESEILERAENKRRKKGADAIVANPVRDGLGPDAEENELWVLRPSAPPVHLGPAPKQALATPLLEALFP